MFPVGMDKKDIKRLVRKEVRKVFREIMMDIAGDGDAGRRHRGGGGPGSACSSDLNVDELIRGIQTRIDAGKGG